MFKIELNCRERRGEEREKEKKERRVGHGRIVTQCLHHVLSVGQCDIIDSSKT